MGFLDNAKKTMEQYDGRDVRRVKVIGVRTADLSKGYPSESFTMYSFLVEFADGSIEIHEEVGNGTGYKKLVKHLVWE